MGNSRRELTHELGLSEIEIQRRKFKGREGLLIDFGYGTGLVQSQKRNDQTTTPLEKESANGEHEGQKQEEAAEGDSDRFQRTTDNDKKGVWPYLKLGWSTLCPRRSTILPVGKDGSHSVITAQSIVDVSKLALQDKKIGQTSGATRTIQEHSR